MSRPNYRKIYEQHHGKIPKDSSGRSFDVHHIDGNHSNNNPTNLTAVAIQEHYDIHYAQGDWAACFLIASKMQLTHSELSELARKSALNRLANGTHPFQTRPDGTNLQIDRIADGTHNLLGGEIQKHAAQQRVSEGTHHLLRRLDGSSLSSDKVADGTHNFLGPEINNQKVANGTHPFLGGKIQKHSAQKRIADGSHNLLSQNRKKVSCPHCPKKGDERLMKRWHFDNCKLKGKIICHT